jgi:titin
MLFGVELLEHRSLLAVVPTFWVTTTADTGAGSLRQAILDSNATPGPNAIDFKIGTGAQTISPILPLPTISTRVTIDGTTQPGYNGTPVVLLNGGAVSGNGLVLGSRATTSSNGSTIRALYVFGFGGNGIQIATSFNLVQDTIIADDAGDGVLITNGAGSNTITGNDVSNNFGNGVNVDSTAFNMIGLAGSGNTIVGNGGDGILLLNAKTNVVEGNAILNNDNNGIEVSGSSGQNNIVGGTGLGAGNIIAGNLGSGINLTMGANINLVEGSVITRSGRDGVDVLGASTTGNTIGGIAAGAGNTISANIGNGIGLIGASGNTIGGIAAGAGNTISANTSDGISIYAGATDDQVLGNVISGNSGNGISLTAGATSDQVLGNDIGTNAAGSSPLSNGGSGVYLANVTKNTIGGIGDGARNIISGNSVSGIRLAGGATSKQVVGNYIGTDSSGLRALPNGVDGVDLDQATADSIGGSADGAGNLISGNAGNGISVTDGATSNQILGNMIGTDASGTRALPNTRDGVNLATVAGNTIGGTTAGDRNVISGNDGSGIDFSGNPANGIVGNLVVGDYIGTDKFGESAVGNVNGISISAASGNTVGGIASGAANLISGNTSIGIQISSSLARGNTVLGNLIGTDKDGSTLLASADTTSGLPVGILINDSPANLIGGTMAGARNVISGFGVAVNISSFNASGNAIQGNLIGTALNGEALTNSNVIGIYINGAGGNLVGGTGAAGNTIMGYTDYGVYLFGSQSTGNVVQGNRIGQRVAKKELAAKHPAQQLSGVAIQGASSNLIGGATSAMGNTILGNAEAGVYVFGHANSASNNKIQKNLFDNNAYGILLFNAANNGRFFTLQRTNRFGKNPIANIREFTGAAPSAAKSSTKTATSSRKHGHRDVRAEAQRHRPAQLRGAGKDRNP